MCKVTPLATFPVGFRMETLELPGISTESTTLLSSLMEQGSAVSGAMPATFDAALSG